MLPHPFESPSLPEKNYNELHYMNAFATTVTTPLKKEKQAWTW